VQMPAARNPADFPVLFSQALTIRGKVEKRRGKGGEYEPPDSTPSCTSAMSFYSRREEGGRGGGGGKGKRKRKKGRRHPLSYNGPCQLAFTERVKRGMKKGEGKREKGGSLLASFHNKKVHIRREAGEKG